MSRQRPTALPLVLLLGATALGAVFFGAPPRFGAVTSQTGFFRLFLEALVPFSVVLLATLLAAGLALSNTTATTGRTALPGGPAAERLRRPLVALFALALLQLVPLPPGVLSLVAPFSGETYAALAVPGHEAWRPLSLWPAGTWIALGTLLGVLTASSLVWGLVGARGGATPERRRAVVHGLLVFVVAVAAAECLYGLHETHLGDDGYLGLAKVSGKGRVTGTFIHGTMAAVWAGMGACAAAGLAARRWLGGTARDRFVACVWVLPALLCAAGAGLSLSRLGFLAAGVGGALVLWWAGAALREGGGRRIGGLLRTVAVAAPVVGLAVVLAVPKLRERIDYLLLWLEGVDVPEEPRFAMWSTTLDLFREAPLLGTGLGSFGRAVHLVQSTDIPQELWFSHSDPLNLLADAGVVGFALGVWWIAALGLRSVRGLRALAPEERALAAGCLGGAVVVLLASVGDFQTQFPVVAIPFAALFTVPAALADRPDGDEAPAAPPGRLPRPLLTGGVRLAVVVATVFPLLALEERWEHAEAGIPPGATHAERLVERAKWRVRRGTELPLAMDEFLEASVEDPLLDEAHLWLGILRQATGQPAEEVLRPIGRARRVSRGHTDVNLLAGRTYLALLGLEPAPFGPPGDGAVPALAEASALSPKAFAVAWQLAREQGFERGQLRELVPRRAHALLTWAEYLARQGDAAAAREALFEAVAVEPRHVVARLRLALRLLQDGDVDGAAAHVARALELEPGGVGFHHQAARHFVDTGHEPAGRHVFEAAGVPWPL